METKLIADAAEWDAWVADRKAHSPHFEADAQLPVLAVWVDAETGWDNPIVYFELFTQPDIFRTLEKMGTV